MFLCVYPGIPVCPGLNSRRDCEEVFIMKRRAVIIKDDLGVCVLPGSVSGNMSRKEHDTEKFQRFIYDFYKNCGRDLPWRRTGDPYRILVSEIMLQQTQVERVNKKYTSFITRFPDIQALSRANPGDVLEEWQGLGYNRRALSLKKTAERICDTYGGVIPEEEKDLVSLPGIGPATASSIRAFAFNKPSVFIETNIRRVFIHCFFADREGVHDSEILPLVSRTLDPVNPREWYWALMDYGAYLGKNIPNPNKRSSHYRKQGGFEGSDRQVRGGIIRTLIKEGKMEKTELLERISADDARGRALIGQLEKEGFLSDDGRTVSLRK